MTPTPDGEPTFRSMNAEPDWDSELETRAEMERDAALADPMRSQCCPMDTYITDLDGEMRPACVCPDFCECMCRDCACSDWSEEEALF